MELNKEVVLEYVLQDISTRANVNIAELYNDLPLSIKYRIGKALNLYRRICMLNNLLNETRKRRKSFLTLNKGRLLVEEEHYRKLVEELTTKYDRLIESIASEINELLGKSF